MPRDLFHLTRAYCTPRNKIHRRVQQKGCTATSGRCIDPTPPRSQPMPVHHQGGDVTSSLTTSVPHAGHAVGNSNASAAPGACPRSPASPSTCGITSPARLVRGGGGGEDATRRESRTVEQASTQRSDLRDQSHHITSHSRDPHQPHRDPAGSTDGSGAVRGAHTRLHPISYHAKKASPHGKRRRLLSRVALSAQSSLSISTTL